jgi:hypothetical protein
MVKRKQTSKPEFFNVFDSQYRSEAEYVHIFADISFRCADGFNEETLLNKLEKRSKDPAADIEKASLLPLFNVPESGAFLVYCNDHAGPVAWYTKAAYTPDFYLQVTDRLMPFVNAKSQREIHWYGESHVRGLFRAGAVTCDETVRDRVYKLAYGGVSYDAAKALNATHCTSAAEDEAFIYVAQTEPRFAELRAAVLGGEESGELESMIANAACMPLFFSRLSAYRRVSYVELLDAALKAKKVS